MRGRSWIVVLAILCAVSGAALAAPGYEQGAQAFERGAYALARSAWEPLAEDNDARAQYGLGLLYANALGVERNALRAQHFYTLAAERGHAGAQYNLAVMRDTGNGVPRDAAQAAFWYGEAARQGLAPAAYNLALMTLAGDGLRREPAKAVAWLDRARPMDRAQLIAALPLAHVAVSAANVRAGPALSAAIVGRAAQGRDMRVFARRGGWAQVWLVESDGMPGTVGWIAARLLEGLPGADAPPARLDRFEFGPLVDLDSRHIQRPDGELATVATTTAGPAPATGTAATITTAAATEMAPSRVPDDALARIRASDDGPHLLRNSRWLVALDTVELGKLASGQPARVATAVLNVRSAPSIDAAILVRLREGEVVHVTERRSGWRRIHLPDQVGSGWVAAFLLSEDVPSVEADTPGRAARIGAPQVNLRAGPSTAAPVVAWLSEGEPVRIIDSRGGWREVLVQGKRVVGGWVAAFLIAGETEPSGETDPQRRAETVDVGASGG